MNSSAIPASDSATATVSWQVNGWCIFLQFRIFFLRIKTRTGFVCS